MISLAAIALRMQGQVIGDEEIVITGVGSLQHAKAGDLAHYANPRYKNQLQNTKASAVLLTQAVAADCPVAAVVVANPQLAFAQLARDFDKRSRVPLGIHATARIDATATLGEGVRIGPNVEIGAHSTIGDDVELAANVNIGAHSSIGNGTALRANVVIYHDVHIGANCTIHSNATLGAEGFGIFPDDAGILQEIPQVGRVLIGDDVLIGSNSTVDRGTIDDTEIHDNVKIDDQVHIGHNCIVGAHSILCGCSGLGGSVTLGEYCVVAGGVGIAGEGPVSIAAGVQIGAMTYVSRDITEPGRYSGATLHTDNPTWRRNMLRLNELASIAKRLRQVENLLDNAQPTLKPASKDK